MVKKEKKNTAEAFINSESHMKHGIHHCKWAYLWMLELFSFNQPSLLGNVPLLSVASPSLLVPALSLYISYSKKSVCVLLVF